MLPIALFAAWWFGYEIVTFLARNRWSLLTRLASGFPLGVIYQSFLALVVQYYIPWGMTHFVIVIGVFVLIALIMHFLNNRFHPSLRISLRIIDAVSLTTFSIFVLYRLHLIYFNGGVYTRGAAYSDFSFHTELISSFAVGCNVNRTSMFGFETVMSAGSPLAYPIFVNFHAAFLITDCDATYPNAMKWTAFIVGVCFVFLIHALTMTFTDGDSYAAALALPLWGFTGGLGFLELFDYWKTEDPNVNYIHTFHNNKKVFWFQSMTHIFHPQRSATFALPLCYLAINALLTGIEKFDWKFFLLAALAVGVTPQTQVHAYVGLAFFSIVLAITTFPFNNKWIRSVKCWSVFGIAANVIALPLCIPYMDRTTDQNEFFDFRPIWQDKGYTKSQHWRLLDVWWKALGVFGMIALVFGYVTCSAKQLRIYIAALAVFFISSTVMFQPWELDNCKVFQDGWLPIAVGFVAQYFSKLWSRTSSVIMRVVLAVLFVASVSSGIVNMLVYEGYDGLLYSRDDAEAGRWAAENTPVNAIYHMSGHVMVPSASYAGRRMFYGYGGWIHSHGLVNETRSKLSHEFDEGNLPDQSRANEVEYQIRAIDADRQGSVDLSPKEWWKPVFEFGRYRIWRLDWQSEETNTTVQRKKKRPRKTPKSPRK